MSSKFSEDSLVETTAANIFEAELGWSVSTAYNQETFGVKSLYGRTNKSQVILKKSFMEMTRELNPGLPDSVYEDTYSKLIEGSVSKSLVEINHEKYSMLRDGIQITYQVIGERKQHHHKMQLIDFKNPARNRFEIVRQLWIRGKSGRERRPDLIGFINGIPLLFIELKNSHIPVEAAYKDNLSDYLDVIPELFHFNAFVILSNGIQARIGSITGKFVHFHEWKRISEEDEGDIQLERMLKGVCEKHNFLDLLENFILFDDSSGYKSKIVAKNHQFLGVNKTLSAILTKNELYKTGQIDDAERRKLGVFWHTQGSGKSYSILFLCQKLLRKTHGTLTFLIITDRNELENQIYGTFAAAGAIPKSIGGGKTKIRAESSEHLKSLLGQNHRYIFSLIHKFTFKEVISSRDDIIIITDEAHRTQGGELAEHLRFALPNAPLLGFTGTPIFKDDERTRRLFGDYVSKYDFNRSIQDGATVPLYYENRGEKLQLKNPSINSEIVDEIETEELLDVKQQLKIKKKFFKEYPVLTARMRLKTIAKDVVNHFFSRGYKGKGMFVAIDKITAVKMYDLMMAQKEKLEKELEKQIKGKTYDDQEELELVRDLQWIKETEICMVVSGEQNEIKKFSAHGLDIDTHREKMNTRDLEKEFKDPDTNFRFVIVCAMWITGFDVPSLSILYIDKPLKAHTLMQTIARANRVYEGKNNGHIVDYIETYKSLLEALSVYGDSSGGNPEGPMPDISKLKEQLRVAIQAVRGFLDGKEVDLDQLIVTSDGKKLLRLIEVASEALMENVETAQKFQKLARSVFKLYSAILPDKELDQFRPAKDVINKLYHQISIEVSEADLSKILAKIQRLVDASIDTQQPEVVAEPDKKFDLGDLDFDALRAMYSKLKNKNRFTFSLVNACKKHLDEKPVNSPLDMDFYKKYEEIIEAYNAGKSREAVEKAFYELMVELKKQSDEQLERKREGLTDEEAVVFNILRKSTLTSEDRKKVREIAIDLLKKLKESELKVPAWSAQTTLAARVEDVVYKKLFLELPSPAYDPEDITIRTNSLLDHLKNVYPGGDRSVFGPY